MELHRIIEFIFLGVVVIGFSVTMFYALVTAILDRRQRTRVRAKLAELRQKVVDNW